MDANERKSDLQEARKYLQRAKELFIGCGERILMWDTNSLIDDVDDAIRDADYEAMREDKEEKDALTKAYFMDAIGALDRL